MSDTFNLGGYNFLVIRKTNPNSPYRVRCIENGSEMDSTSSHKDAAESIIQHIAFAKGILETNSKSVAFVKETFVKVLMGAKKSECDNLVEECIANRKRISGTVYYYPEKEQGQNYKEYTTEYFYVKVICQSTIPFTVIDVEVTSKKEDE